MYMDFPLKREDKLIDFYKTSRRLLQEDKLYETSQTSTLPNVYTLYL